MSEGTAFTPFGRLGSKLLRKHAAWHIWHIPLTFTSRKFVRLVFGLLVKNQLYTGEKLDTEFNTETE